jgi:hypothetical protein
MLTIGEVFALTKLNFHNRKPCQKIVCFFHFFRLLRACTFKLFLIYFIFCNLIFSCRLRRILFYFLTWHLNYFYLLSRMEILASLLILTKREKSTLLLSLFLQLLFQPIFLYLLWVLSLNLFLSLFILFSLGIPFWFYSFP